MQCHEIMAQNPSSIGVNTSIQQAAAKMAEADVGFLPVCDAETHVVGTLTDRDIAVRGVAQHKALDTPVEEVMTREVISCAPDTDVEEARVLMQQQQVSRLICLEDGQRLRGVLSLADLAGVGPQATGETISAVKMPASEGKGGSQSGEVGERIAQQTATANANVTD